MDNVVDAIKATCTGLAPEEIEQQILASQNADKIPDAGQVSRFLAALCQADGDPTGEEPVEEASPEQAGND